MWDPNQLPIDPNQFYIASVQRLDQLVFLAEVVAIGVGVLWGSMTLRLVVLAKNQSRFW